ncbi:MAG: glycosyltransferase [Lachnospiraceae bacterium]
MNELISIVVPIYNAGNFLCKCLDSIRRQSYNKYEAILIDDGSLDKSYEICKRYVKCDTRFKVYHIENSGLSVARNYGAAKASGKYITFIDSDDFITDDYLKKLYSLMKRYSADISVGAIKQTMLGDKLKIKRTNNELIMTGKEAVLNMLYQKDLGTSPCSVLLPRSIVLKYPFPEGKYHEDDFTTYKYFLEVNKVAILKDPLYFYVQHRNSIMHTRGKADYDQLDAADNLVSVFANTDYKLLKAAFSKKFSNYCQVLINCPGMKKEDFPNYQRIIKFLHEYKFSILFDKNSRIKNKCAALSLCIGTNGLFFMQKIRELLLCFK